LAKLAPGRTLRAPGGALLLPDGGYRQV